MVGAAGAGESATLECDFSERGKKSSSGLMSVQ